MREENGKPWNILMKWRGSLPWVTRTWMARPLTSLSSFMACRAEAALSSCELLVPCRQNQLFIWNQFWIFWFKDRPARSRRCSSGVRWSRTCIWWRRNRHRRTCLGRCHRPAPIRTLRCGRSPSLRCRRPDKNPALCRLPSTADAVCPGAANLPRILFPIDIFNQEKKIA